MTDEEHCNTGTKSRPAVPVTGAGGIGRRDRGHADDVRGEGVGVRQEFTAAPEREGVSRPHAVEP